MTRLVPFLVPLSLLACAPQQTVREGLYAMVDLETDCERGPEQTSDLALHVGCEDDATDCDLRWMVMEQSGIERRRLPIACDEQTDGRFHCDPTQSDSYHLTVTPMSERLDVTFEQYLSEDDPVAELTETPYCTATYSLRLASDLPERDVDFSFADRLLLVLLIPILAVSL